MRSIIVRNIPVIEKWHSTGFDVVLPIILKQLSSSFNSFYMKLKLDKEKYYHYQEWHTRKNTQKASEKIGRLWIRYIHSDRFQILLMLAKFSIKK